MNPDTIYETETMAELCARQGRVGEAIDIYRRLADSISDKALRARIERRLDTLQATWQPPRQIDVRPADVPIPTAPHLVDAIVPSVDSIEAAVRKLVAS